jgi:hypothetical protein
MKNRRPAKRSKTNRQPHNRKRTNMSQAQSNTSSTDRRTELRTTAEDFYSVEINLGGNLPVYRFKLRDISDHGICILIKKQSPLLPYLQVGGRLDLQFYSDQRDGVPRLLATEIRHITEGKPGNFKGHVLVGLQVLVGSTAE